MDICNLFIIILLTIILFLFILSGHKQSTTNKQLQVKKTYNKSLNTFDKFTDSTQNTTNYTFVDSPSVSFSIQQQIASLISISPRRILNLTYDTHIINGTLQISFAIDKPNFIETHSGELSSTDAKNTLNSIINAQQFNINLLGKTVILKLANQELSGGMINGSLPISANLDYTKIPTYFNNDALLDIADYTHNVYNVVPTDKSLTQFYTLDMDNNFKVILKSPPKTQ